MSFCIIECFLCRAATDDAVDIIRIMAIIVSIGLLSAGICLPLLDITLHRTQIGQMAKC
jgi:hypothetical protein